MRGTMINLPGGIRPASKTALKWHKKANVEPDMATYWCSSMLYKFLITNWTCSNYFQLMIVKMPLTKDKNMLYWYF